MSRETSLIKKIVALNEDDVSHDSYMLTILCDIADSLAVIADKLTDKKSMSNEVLHKSKNGSDYPAKIMVEDREYIPVVRCKDCKHQRNCSSMMNIDYCSYGERKDG
jgi:hypothetical protein